MSRGGAAAAPRGEKQATGPAGGPPRGGPPAPRPGGGPASAGGGPGGALHCASPALGAATAAPSNALADRVSKVFLNIPFLLQARCGVLRATARERPPCQSFAQPRRVGLLPGRSIAEAAHAVSGVA